MPVGRMGKKWGCCEAGWGGASDQTGSQWGWQQRVFVGQAKARSLWLGQVSSMPGSGAACNLPSRQNSAEGRPSRARSLRVSRERLASLAQECPPARALHSSGPSQTAQGVSEPS